jgi:hypothetical protein
MSAPVTIERTSFGEYARSRDVTRPYISKLAKTLLAPAIVVDETGRPWINREAADAILASRGDPGRRAGSRERKARAEGRVAPPAPAAGRPSKDTATSNADAQYQADRAEGLRIENELRRVKLDAARGNLIDRGMGERLVRDMASGFGKMIERYPDRIAAQIAAQLGVDGHKCRALLASMAKELRGEFEKLAMSLPERIEATEQ